MRSFLRSLKEELWALFHDSGRMLIVVGAPLIYALIYSACYGAEVVREIPIGIVDEEHSEASRQLQRAVSAGDVVQIVAAFSNLSEAREALLRREIYGVLYIPRGYQRRILAQEPGVVALLLDASNFLLYKQSLQQMAVATLQQGAIFEGERFIVRGLPEPEIRALIQPILYTEQTLYNPNTGYGIFVLPGVLILILQQTLLIGIGMRGKK